MTFRPIAAAALAAVLLGAARPAPLIVYGSPAGDRPAGADAAHPTDAILPDGRIAAPAGRSVFVGTNPLGMALTPDGRYAIVSNGDERTGGLAIPPSEPPLAIGYSLAVVDTQTMAVVSVYRDPSTTFFMGVAAAPNPLDASQTIVLASDGGAGVVRVFGLDASGQLTPSLPITLPARPGTRAYPAGIAMSPDGHMAYVADNLQNAVSVIDVATRSVVRTIDAGNFPLDIAANASRLLVSAGGLMSYSPLPSPEREPHFTAPSFDPDRSSAMTVFNLAGNGDVAGQAIVPMDPQPDGITNVGGAAPGSIVLSRDGRLAYVAMANVDRVAVVALDGAPKVVRGLDLRLYPEAPYGAAPSAQALSADGKRLYVALAGMNAVAVLDARTPTRYRYGLIPTGWYPDALALSPDGRFLYALSAKGVDGWGLLQKVDLKHSSLVKTTLDSLKYNRSAAAAKFDAVVPPLR
ncbi:MAG: YncE family protein, partial [Candidatus Eremiobacteraeota bacterium]|nr:YncE family protein [Candidatus Eremiobacteraeota bacterium]